MKTKSKILLLALLFAAIALPLWADESPAVLGVDTLAAKPADYAGKPLHLTGIVHRVSTERRMIVLIDLSEANCTDSCTPASVLVHLAKDGNLPSAKETILVVGKLEKTSPPITLKADEWVTGKEAIESRLRQGGSGGSAVPIR